MYHHITGFKKKVNKNSVPFYAVYNSFKSNLLIAAY
jgi:hypothetical protein